MLYKTDVIIIVIIITIIITIIIMRMRIKNTTC